MAEGDGGNGSPITWDSFKESLPEDIRDHPSLASFSAPGDLAKSWVNVQKLVGKDKIPVPSSPEDAEAWNTVYSRLGKPETIDGYVLKTDDIPKELPIDENFLKDFKDTAFKLNLLPNQVEGLFNWWMGVEKGILEEMSAQDETERQTAEAELRKSWGKAYDQNVRLANSMVTKFGGEDKDKILSKYGNDLMMIRFLADIGKAFSEDGIIGEVPQLTLTPAEAEAEIGKIMGDEKHAYYDTNNPEHQAAVNHVQALYKLVYPEGTK